ncbi:MAG: hypothetical protein GY851_35380 [bacterium]|nr:hypothetical protein [bacterium]
MPTRQQLADIVAIFALCCSVGCTALDTGIDGSEPPTGWADVRMSQLSPGRCLERTMAYCHRLRAKDVPACILVFQHATEDVGHAIVATVDSRGRSILVDVAAGECWWNEHPEVVTRVLRWHGEPQ